MGILETIGFIAAIVGIMSFAWFLRDRFIPLRRLSWKDVNRGTRMLAAQMLKEDFLPTLILGIG